MSNLYTDLSQLKRNLVPPAPPAPPPPPPKREDDAAMPAMLREMMGEKPAPRSQPVAAPRTTAQVALQKAQIEASANELALEEVVKENLALTQELEAVKAENAALAAAKADLEAQLKAAGAAVTAKLEAANAEQAAQLQAANAGFAAKMAELVALQRSAAAKVADLEAQVAGFEETKNLAVQEAAVHAASTSVLLDRPETLEEVFPGEVREHVIAALKDAFAAAESGNRQRRARILEAVLAMNVASGELERRRGLVKAVVREGGNFVDNGTIKALEALGFRYVSGRNHHKFDFGGVRLTMSKTPSDYRSGANNSAEINNLAF